MKVYYTSKSKGNSGSLTMSLGVVGLLIGLIGMLLSSFGMSWCVIFAAGTFTFLVGLFLAAGGTTGRAASEIKAVTQARAKLLYDHGIVLGSNETMKLFPETRPEDGYYNSAVCSYGQKPALLTLIFKNGEPHIGLTPLYLPARIKA